jgi:NADPH:quinone reductase-like Zn-dependent oxidoreductase
MTSAAAFAEEDLISTTMRAMVLDEFGGSFRLERRPVPEPGRDEVLIQVLAAGAGVTNELARDGVLGGSVPRVHGHELSGRIVAVGVEVRDWAIGDRVTTSFYLLYAGIAGAVRPALVELDDEALSQHLTEAGRRTLGLRTPRRPTG